MKNSKNKIKNINGITLISLVITIIILIILAGISISSILGNDGILNKSKTASEKYKKQSAIEMMNLKITTCQMQSYTENGKLPTLAYLAAFLQNDKETTGDIAYVEMQSQKQANLDETPYTNWDKLYTKLSAYPSYEFEINRSLQLASINGVKIANNETPSTEYVKKSDYENLLRRVETLENNTLSTEVNNLKTQNVLASNLVYNININNNAETYTTTYINTEVQLNDDIDKYNYLLIEYANHNTHDGTSAVYGNKTSYLIRTDEIEYTTAWINSYILMINQNTGSINTSISFKDKNHLYVRNTANYSNVADKIKINVIGISKK